MDTEVWYPSLSLPKGADLSRFNDEVVVILAELKRLRRQLVGIGKRKLRLLPGAGIGPVRAKLPKKATDFVWCGFRLLASRRAIAILEEHGVYVPHGPAIVQVGKETTDTYVALELDPVPLYSDATLKETTLTYCRHCGSCEMQDATVDMGGDREYVRRRMPKGQGLVRVYESPGTLASEEFMRVVRSERLTGIEFEEDGSFV